MTLLQFVMCFCTCFTIFTLSAQLACACGMNRA
jgi:hypothetical protein